MFDTVLPSWQKKQGKYTRLTSTGTYSRRFGR